MEKRMTTRYYTKADPCQSVVSPERAPEPGERSKVTAIFSDDGDETDSGDDDLCRHLRTLWRATRSRQRSAEGKVV